MSYYTGSKWGAAGFGAPGGQVTWSFATLSSSLLTFDASIASASFQDAIRAAFDLWESVANIDFVETADSADNGIRLGWDQFDGAGGVLGQAAWLYIGGTTIYSEIGFDLGDNWRPSTYWSGGGEDFYMIAVHEIGHAIGLSHSDDPGSMMYAYADGQKTLSVDDVAAIRALYGWASMQIDGTDASEQLIGGSAGDRIGGGFGRDTIIGAEGDDILSGNQDGDEIFGNQGLDTIFGGQGDDSLYGGQGGDRIEGNFGNDIVFANMGEDWVHGGQGDDWMHGGQGNDVLLGGLGNDTLNGGVGNDTLTGGEGADLFVFGPGSGSDIITDISFAQGDRLDLQGQAYTVGSSGGGQATIVLSGGGTIVLTGVSPSEFPALLA